MAIESGPSQLSCKRAHFQKLHRVRASLKAKEPYSVFSPPAQNSYHGSKTGCSVLIFHLLELIPAAAARGLFRIISLSNGFKRRSDERNE